MTGGPTATEKPKQSGLKTNPLVDITRYNQRMNDPLKDQRAHLTALIHNACYTASGAEASSTTIARAVMQHLSEPDRCTELADPYAHGYVQCYELIGHHPEGPYGVDVHAGLDSDGERHAWLKASDLDGLVIK